MGAGERSVTLLNSVKTSEISKVCNKGTLRGDLITQHRKKKKIIIIIIKKEKKKAEERKKKKQKKSPHRRKKVSLKTQSYAVEFNTFNIMTVIRRCGISIRAAPKQRTKAGQHRNTAMPPSNSQYKVSTDSQRVFSHICTCQ